MRVISLAAENFKRLKAVEIIPSGDLVEITGDNAEGKTSTLDAIWAALGGKDACPEKPIRSGADKAEITVVIGEGEPKLKVTRRFRLKEGVPYTTDLIVENAEGARFGKPQDILNQLLGEFAFDPLAFTRLKDDEQVKALRRFVPDVDFEEMEALNKGDFDARTEVNRKIRDLKGQISALPTPPSEAPASRVDIGALEQKLADAATYNGQIEQRKARREAARTRLDVIRQEIARLQAEQTALEVQITSAGELPEPVDIDAVREELAQGRRTNQLIDQLEAHRRIEAQIVSAEVEATERTLRIQQRKKAAQAAVAAARMPVPGLGIAQDEDSAPFVTFNGEPFAQASQAEKIRVSVAIAAAMNPKLRVARVADGSLLDRKSWTALETYAREHDLQVWVETVQQHGAAAILIEDGSTAAAESVGDVI